MPRLAAKCVPCEPDDWTSSIQGSVRVGADNFAVASVERSLTTTHFSGSTVMRHHRFERVLDQAALRCGWGDQNVIADIGFATILALKSDVLVPRPKPPRRTACAPVRATSNRWISVV